MTPLTAPTLVHRPTSTGSSPRRATIVEAPATMTMKNDPGGLNRSAFCTKPPTVAMQVANSAGSISHHWDPPAPIWAQATEPTKAPTVAPVDSSRPAMSMMRQRVR